MGVNPCPGEAPGAAKLTRRFPFSVHSHPYATLISRHLPRMCCPFPRFSPIIRQFLTSKRLDQVSHFLNVWRVAAPEYR